MTDLEKLEEAVQVTSDFLADALGAKKAKIKDARAAIDKEYAEKVSFARQKAAQADKDLRDYKSETASHPWEGRRVKRRDVVYGRYYTGKPTTIYGIVEVRRIGTQFPDNLANYSTPKIGESFVRLLLKNGKPGKRFDKSYKSIEASEWEWDD